MSSLQSEPFSGMKKPTKQWVFWWSKTTENRTDSLTDALCSLLTVSVRIAGATKNGQPNITNNRIKVKGKNHTTLLKSR